MNARKRLNSLMKRCNKADRSSAGCIHTDVQLLFGYCCCLEVKVWYVVNVVWIKFQTDTAGIYFLLIAVV